MPIIKHEVRMARTALIGFTSGMVMVFTVFFSVFDIYKEGAALLDQLLQNFPTQFKAAFGFQDVKLSEFNGFMSFIFGYIVLIGAVFGMKLGVSVLSEEMRTKTADFLLTKPITRRKIVGCKMTAVLILLAVQNVILLGVSLVEVLIFLDESFSLRLLLLFNISVFLVQLFFVGAGLLISVLFRRIKNVMPVTLAVVFLFFTIGMINESIMDERLNYLTPFSYFKGIKLLENLSYDPRYLAVDLAAFLIFSLIGYGLYLKQDIHCT